MNADAVDDGVDAPKVRDCEVDDCGGGGGDVVSGGDGREAERGEFCDEAGGWAGCGCGHTGIMVRRAAEVIYNDICTGLCKSNG